MSPACECPVICDVTSTFVLNYASYFNRDYLEGYFLCRPELAQFFDKEVLEKFYSVGGVRIEDDILVTRGGYENLSSAPKGQAMLDVINGKSK